MPLADLHPTSILVMLAWLRQVPGVPPAAVATRLPAVENWAVTGFVTVPFATGGTPTLDIPERQTVLQVDTWAANVDSKKVPLGAANQLAECVIAATYTRPMGEVTLPAQYKPVYIETIFSLTEPREIPESESNYAHFSVDLEMHWIEREPVESLLQ